MKIKIFRTAVIFSGLFTAMINLYGETPMEFFKDFRKNIEANEFASAAIKFEDSMKDRILKSGRIPREMRQNILAVEAAYEDVYIRQQNPELAVIYAFKNVNGQRKSLQINLRQVGNSWVFSGYPFREKLPPAPDELAKRFMLFCRNGEMAGIEEYVTGKVDKSLGSIPEGLLAKADFTVSGGSGSSAAEVTIRRYGLDATLSFEKFGDFWKITAIDDLLKQPVPDQLLPRLVAKCKTYNAQYPPLEIDSEIEDAAVSSYKEEKESKPAAETNTEDALKNAVEKKYNDAAADVTLSPQAEQPEYPELKAFLTADLKLSTSDVVRLATFSEITGTDIKNGKVVFAVKIDNNTETGKYLITYAHDGSNWLVSEVNADLVYRKSESPENATDQFCQALKRKNVSQLLKTSTGTVKLLFESDEEINKLFGKTTFKDFTWNITDCKIYGEKSAAANLTWENTATGKSGTATIKLLLEKSKWRIFSFNINDTAEKTDSPEVNQ